MPRTPASPDWIDYTRYLDQTALLGRGWTLAAVRRFLGNPDRTAPNPIFKSAAPRRLFDRERVEAIEASEDFKAWAEASKRRKAAAAKGVSTKTKALMDTIRGWTITVKRRDLKRVTEAACRSYNDSRWDREDFIPAGKGSDPAFLERITVNHIRHELSSYEDRLEALFGKTGKEAGYLALSEKIFSAIKAAYPELAAECDRQFAARRNPPA